MGVSGGILKQGIMASWLIPLLAGGFLFLAGVGSAQPPRGEDATTVQGKVERFTSAPRGEVDGAVLDEGTWLHWPPHLENRLANLLKVGDRVRATGRTETGPAGDTHFEVQSVMNLRTNARADNPDFANGPPLPPPARRGRAGRAAPPPPPDVNRPATKLDDAAGTVEGRVDRFTTAPRGETDGAVLNDGTWLHWPPHMQDRFANFLKTGDRVRASGRTETGPRGDTHFEVESVINLRTNARADNPDFAFGPPPGPRGRGGRIAPPPPPPPLPGPGRRPAGADRDNAGSAAQGRVDRFTTAPRGEVDGAVLDDGTWLHWPPHMQERFANILKEGDRVRATGRTETGPKGDTHFEVQSITNLRTNARADNPDFANRPRP